MLRAWRAPGWWRGCRSAACAAAALLAGASPAAAQPEASFALRAGRVYTAASSGAWRIENGVVIVRDGKIERVGDSSTPIPLDLPVIDLPDATVMPGLVAAASGLVGPHAGDQSISGAYRAVDGFDVFGDYRLTLASGVTVAHVDPGPHRLVSGRGAVVRLGGDPGSRVLLAESDLAINLGEEAFDPPDLMKLLVPPSADRLIEPAVPQSPRSRLGQFVALKAAVERALNPEAGAAFDMHAAALGEAWRSGLPLRVRAQRSADVLGALAHLEGTGRRGYVVSGADAGRAAAALERAGVGLVYTLDLSLRSPGADVGGDPEAVEPGVDGLRDLAGVPALALAVAPSRPLADLRLAAAAARSAGLDERRAVEAITRVPAEILGVSDRVGSLEPGRDADLLVLTGGPVETSSHVHRVYVAGRLEYERRASGALVVKAGTIWRGPNDWLEDGSILIEGGKIVAVGRRVPHPPDARVIDAGPGSFVTPGLIDARGHLGLGGDETSPAPEVSLAGLVGASGLAERRVASSGVTTVVTAPYRVGTNGSQYAAVKTAGRTRADRLVRPTAALAFDVSDMDPLAIPERLKPRLEAGKKYLEQWQKHAADLAAWEKARAEGKAAAQGPKVVEEAATDAKADPLTGTWRMRVSGGPLPEAIEGNVALKLTGTEFEGRVIEPAAAEVEHRIAGTLDGNAIKGQIEVDTGGLGYPEFSGTLEGEDKVAGSISFQGISVNFEGTRTDRAAVEFKVVRKRRTAGKDGRPLPPKVDEALEPLRLALEKKIPLVVGASTPAQVDAVLDLLVDEWQLPVVLLEAPGARAHAARLAEKGVGVVLPTGVIRRENFEWVHQGDELSRRGVAVAFQSDAEDGARTLPLVALYAVERGLSAEEALAALTIDAARMYRIDDRVGSIAPGRDGDLVIFSGAPFDAGSRVQRVIVNGEEVRE